MPRIAIAAAVALVALSPAGAGGQDRFEAGRAEFVENCAVCHGLEGRGNGPLAPMLTLEPSDLTALTRDNDGTFPEERLYRIIDGRGKVEGHGPSEMPVWGWEYGQEAKERYGQRYGSHDAEQFVTGKILSLIHYIREIQQE